MRCTVVFVAIFATFYPASTPSLASIYLKYVIVVCNPVRRARLPVATLVRWPIRAFAPPARRSPSPGMGARFLGFLCVLYSWVVAPAHSGSVFLSLRVAFV